MQPFHEHKRTSFAEGFKTLKDVFDLTTEETLWKLIKQGYIRGLESPLSIGKEANVFTARTSDEELRIVKIYRVMTCDFGKMYSYIQADPRFPGIHKNKRNIVSAWCQREYRNLLKAREAGCRVPTPYVAMNNVLIMEFIGNEDAAQRLSKQKPQDPTPFFKEVVKNMQILHKAGLVHGDLSQFNILNYDEKPVFIDFSQATTKENSNFPEYFERDVKNVANYFAKIGVRISEEELFSLIAVSPK